MSFFIHALELGPMENLIHLIVDQATQRMAVVDPAWAAAEINAFAQAHQTQITDILLTHSHYDHVNDLEPLLKMQTARVHLLEAEANFWGRHQDNFVLHQTDDVIRLGETPITIWHAPGHTPGSACYALDSHLITGDTLFIYGCGRCDLAGGDPEQLYYTLKQLVAHFPPQTVIHPGHHYAKAITSTLAEQLAGNPFLHFERCADFIQYRTYQHDRERSAPYQPVTRAI